MVTPAGGSGSSDRKQLDSSGRRLRPVSADSRNRSPSPSPRSSSARLTSSPSMSNTRRGSKKDETEECLCVAVGKKCTCSKRAQQLEASDKKVAKATYDLADTMKDMDKCRYLR